MEKKLEVKNLQISFRTQGGIVKAVRDISFDLYKGETLAIVGESGSGKSVTSKSIMGILSGNSIVEGGQLLYDGQDLLKISEDDFHKIRGDKIAMIFQDPMSSLNPIMRVGRQLTEAMLLKIKTSRRNSRAAFNTTLKRLNDSIDEVTVKENPESVKNNKVLINKFDAFCINSIKLEEEYNIAYSNAVALDLKVDDVLFLIDKKQKVDYKKVLKEIKKLLNSSLHSFIIRKDEEVDNVLLDINTNSAAISNDKSLFISLLNRISAIVKSGLEKEKPNYFTLGYYMMENPDADVLSMSTSELNKMTRTYIDDHFMISFIKLAGIGVKNSHDKSIAKKKEILVKATEALEYFENFDKESINHKQAVSIVNTLADLVNDAIDRLVTKKNSVEYNFASAIKSSLSFYFKGLKNNPIELKRYQKEEEKYNKIISSGKVPEYKLLPAKVIDLELSKQNICLIIKSLLKVVTSDIDSDLLFDVEKQVVELIDFFKEEASKAVARLTKEMAKAKALKLLEEVGIPEPKIRYNQYPFEFSGGMRQRIVIAIALSANPDILICDEPTTALDVTIQSQILELINKLKVERNLSIIFITHNLGVVANMADRIGVMYAGKIVEIGTSEEVFYSPAHPYTWALLSSMPDLHTKEKLEAIPGTPPNMIYPPKGDAFADRNKYALEIDFELQPPMFEITPTHFAATWLLHPNAPKVEMPKIIRDRIERMKKGDI